MATNPAASGSGGRGGRELARTAHHIPQGTKSLGRKVRVLFNFNIMRATRLAYSAPLALISLVISGEERKP
jgi:hypothetical protein